MSKLRSDNRVSSILIRGIVGPIRNVPNVHEIGYSQLASTRKETIYPNINACATLTCLRSFMFLSLARQKSNFFKTINTIKY